MSRMLQTLSKSSHVKDSLTQKIEECLIIWINDCNRNKILQENKKCNENCS